MCALNSRELSPAGGSRGRQKRDVPEGQARETASVRRIPCTAAVLRCRGPHTRTGNGLQEIRTAPTDSQQGTQSHNCKELNFADNLNKLRGGFFPKSQKGKQPCQLLDLCAMRPILGSNILNCVEIIKGYCFKLLNVW